MRRWLEQHWQALIHEPAGRRFVARYEAAHATRKNASWTARARRLLRLLLALVLVAIGVAEAFLPGPAILFFFVAGRLFKTLEMGRELQLGGVKFCDDFSLPPCSPECISGADAE